ncbi:hypothetical protein BDY19DRAFT_214451 [Irpex rosettiformis]|uniref:Uncharacterized protein n=1 Tax=Irpex rosettiformis TaxID=378272 RepID=A0ACB8U2C6_9APHY|nr:hypothetical protein BDY19DRAFT_214451 [Irpex rosettiformis]
MPALTGTLQNAANLSADFAQTLSNFASSQNTATAIIAERIIVDAASILLVLNTLCALKRAIGSFVNQLPEAVDTLIQIKSILVGNHEWRLEQVYLERFKRIQRVVRNTVMEAADDKTFNPCRRFNRMKKIAKANKEADRLMEDIKLAATNITDSPPNPDVNNAVYDLENQHTMSEQNNRAIMTTLSLNVHSFSTLSLALGSFCHFKSVYSCVASAFLFWRKCLARF